MLSKKLSKGDIFLQNKMFFSVRQGYLFWSPLRQNEGMPRSSVLLKGYSLDHLELKSAKGPALDLLTQKLWAEVQEYEF